MSNLWAYELSEAVYMLILQSFLVYFVDFVFRVATTSFSFCSSTASLPAWMPDESDAKQILTASPWRTGDHRDAPGLRGWRLPSRTWNHWTSPWMKQLTWLRIVHSEDWCLCLALRTPSGACQKWMNEWSCNVICYRVKLGTCCRLISRT